MSNLRCTFSKMYLPHLLPFDYLGDSSLLDRKEIFPSLILFRVFCNLVIGHQGQEGTDETNVFTVLVLRFSAQITSMHFCRIFHYQKQGGRGLKANHGSVAILRALVTSVSPLPGTDENSEMEEGDLGVRHGASHHHQGSPCEPKTACHPYMPKPHQKGIFLSGLYLQLT